MSTERRRQAQPAPVSNRDFPDFEHSLPMLLLRAREAVMERFRPMLRGFGLTEQQWRVIRALVESSGMDASELSAASYIKPPSLSRILQNLEGRGLIRRRKPRRDRRRARIALTARGRQLFGRVVPHSREHYSAIAQALGAEKMAELYALLDETRKRLELE